MTAGGVAFDVWALSGNAGGGAAGDGGGEAYLTFTYGCSGTSFYPDGDSDGYGSKVLPMIRECTKPPFRVEDNTDCNDYEAKIHPGQPDICNVKDDNCNGQIDENLPMMTLYEDKDGDGVGVPQHHDHGVLRADQGVRRRHQRLQRQRPDHQPQRDGDVQRPRRQLQPARRRRGQGLLRRPAGAAAPAKGAGRPSARPASRATSCATRSTTTATAWSTTAPRRAVRRQPLLPGGLLRPGHGRWSAAAPF